jgi:hypothetical protein
MGVPPKGSAKCRTRGRAATGCAALRHFVLAARAATLHIPARKNNLRASRIHANLIARRRHDDKAICFLLKV